MTSSILGSGLVFLDSTAVNIALPTVGHDLDTGLAGFQWIVNGYLLALSAFILLGGSLGDRFGRRRIFNIGTALFGFASLLCGIAPSTAMLIAARSLQGVGGALLVPTSLAMLHAAFHPSDRGEAVGSWSGFSGLATIVGPLLGGWLIDHVSWRAVFLINPALSAVAIWMGSRYVPETHGDQASKRLDFPGTTAVAVALAGIVYAAIEGPRSGWTSPPILAATGVGLVALVAFFLIERHSPHPMLPLHLFRSQTFRGANATSATVYFVLGGVFFLLAIHLQEVVGYNALEAGAVTVPVTLLLFLLSPLAGRLAGRIGPRLPTAVGLFITAVGTGLLSGIDADAQFVSDILPGLLIFGIGLGLTVAPLTTAALSSLDESRVGLASGVNNAVTRAAQLLAIALLPFAAGLSRSDATPASVSTEGFFQAMWIAAVMLLVGSGTAWWTLPTEPPGGETFEETR